MQPEELNTKANGFDMPTPVFGGWWLRGAMSVCLVVVLLATLAGPASASTASVAPPNLIINGSFESPSVAAATYRLWSTGQSFPGWRVVGATGNVAIVEGTFAQNGFRFPAGAGKQWLDLTGVSNTPTGVQQTVKTSVGRTYTLRFLVGNVVDPGGIFGVKSTVDVLVNGARVFVATNSAGSGKKVLIWKRYAVSIAASSGETSIAFINGDPSNDTSNGLDGVSLT
jgi:hypothetical protein